mgnify:CR=1 FL=1
MKKNNDFVQACIYKLYDFRSNIPANLSKETVKNIWDIEISESDIPQNIRGRSKILDRKINIAQDSLELLLLKRSVRFIGVSGSVGSEFAKEGDDIDLFIVVKNDTAWIYRLCLYFRNLSKRKIRSKEKVIRGEDVKDKFCINLITEERSLIFEEDIFNFNELIYIKPVYNKNFLNVIYLNNSWLKDKYLVSEKFLRRDLVKMGDVKKLTKRNFLLIPINFCLFLSQIIYMLLMRHGPDYRRLWKGFVTGRIEFFPKDFRKGKIKDF